MIFWYRFLDSLQSFWNRSRKAIKFRRRWGADWRNKERTGRRFTRVEWWARFDMPSGLDGIWRLRPVPGWEWTCMNCKTYSLVLPSLVAIWKVDNAELHTDMFKEWQELAQKTAARGFKPPSRPTPPMAPCPNCKYRPGAPE